MLHPYGRTKPACVGSSRVCGRWEMNACWGENVDVRWWEAEDLCSHSQKPRGSWVIFPASLIIILACWLTAIGAAIGLLLLARAVLQVTGVLP